MAAKQEINKNTANNTNCSLCTKFIKILKHKPEGETELKCDDCKKDDPVVALCIDCELYLCQDCNNYHKKKNSEHDIVSLIDIPSFTKDSAVAEKVLYCPAHEKNELDYYCKTCDKIVCLYCTVKDHVGHTHDLVRNTATEHRNMLMKVIAPVEEMSKNLSKAEANIVSTQEKIKEQASEIDQEIDKCYVERLQKLNEHHQKLKKDLHHAVSQKETALKKQLEEIKSVQDELVSMKELREDLEKTSDHKVLSKKQQDVEDQVKEVSEKYKKLNTQPVTSYTLAFNPSQESFVKLGHLSKDLTLEIPFVPNYIVINKKVKLHMVSKDENGQDYTKGGS